MVSQILKNLKGDIQFKFNFSISRLQIVQAEMEVQHRRFEHLQEESAKVLSHLPQDSPGQEKIPSELEMVQDRLDCLVSIIEAQTQRVSTV